jgi:hypothetical protein
VKRREREKQKLRKEKETQGRKHEEDEEEVVNTEPIVESINDASLHLLYEPKRKDLRSSFSSRLSCIHQPQE